MMGICSWVAFGRAPDGDVFVLSNPNCPIFDENQHLLARCAKLHVDPQSLWWVRYDSLDAYEQRIMNEHHRIIDLEMRRQARQRGDADALVAD